MEIDITPAMNSAVPRSMLMPVGGVDPSSTRTFLPLALHTSSGIYNQKMNEADKMIMSKAKVMNRDDPLGASIGQELLMKDEVDDYLEEKFDDLHDSSSDDELICETCMNSNDELGGSSTVMNNILLQKHMKDSKSKSSETIDNMFNIYLKDNKEISPVGTHNEGELQNIAKKGDDGNNDSELTELIGNGVVYDNPSNSLSIPLIVIILIISFVFVLMMFYTCLFYGNCGKYSTWNNE